MRVYVLQLSPFLLISSLFFWFLLFSSFLLFFFFMFFRWGTNQPVLRDDETTSIWIWPDSRPNLRTGKNKCVSIPSLQTIEPPLTGYAVREIIYKLIHLRDGPYFWYNMIKFTLTAIAILRHFTSAVRVCSRTYFFLCANLVWGLAKFKCSSSHRP